MKKIKVKGNADKGREVIVHDGTATLKEWKGFGSQMAMWINRYARV